MYKLMVLAGPNRGSSYAVHEGENPIGRQAGNTVVLTSSKVSKRHCVLVYSRTESSEPSESSVSQADDSSNTGISKKSSPKKELVLVKDNGSSNGTFVNGVLTAERELKHGDKISVGEFVLQLVKLDEGGTARPPSAVQAPKSLNGFTDFIRFAESAERASGDLTGTSRPKKKSKSKKREVAPAIAGLQLTYPSAPQQPQAYSPPPMDSQLHALQADAEPKELKARLLWHFEKKIMPFFYGMILKSEWKGVAAGIFSIFVLISVVVCIYPLMESNRVMVIQQAKKRAVFMARLIAERNAPNFAAHTETKSDLGFAESITEIHGSSDIRLARLMDMEGRVIAPTQNLGQYISSGPEGVVLAQVMKPYLSGQLEEGIAVTKNDTVVAIEPVRVVSMTAGKNVTVGLSLVSIDIEVNTMDMGEMGLFYSQAIILIGLLGMLVALIVYRMTLKPFQILGEDMDRVLKGEMPQVTREFKFSELEPLWDLINSALQRLPRGGSLASASNEELVPSIEQYAGPAKLLGENADFGMVICDGERRVVYINPFFENITGIRAETSLGQELLAVARDQAQRALLADVLDRALVGGEPVVEDGEFSGVVYKLSVAAFGAPGGLPKCFLIQMNRGGGSS